MNTRNDIAPTLTPKEYSLLLKQRGITYRSNNQWLQVGKPTKTNTWLLHITVSVIQAPELIKQILPVIQQKKIPFQLIKDTHAHFQLNVGHFGHDSIGKMLTLFPEHEEQAKEIISLLLPLTEQASGVFQRNALRLGKVLYATTADGKKIPCPFTISKAYLPKKNERILTIYYLLFDYIVQSQKGNVYKAIYWPALTWQVVKQAPACIAEDNTGRDARNRLQSEYKILLKINGKVPSPKVRCFISRAENCYLVMQYLEGCTLETRILELLNGNTWKNTAPAVKRLLLNYFLQAVHITEQLHRAGVIFRDLKPKNFIVSPKGKLSAIDFEIAYDVQEQQPNPPFFFGDPSYTAPEQYQYATPTIKEDIFSIGATLVFLLTGKDPATVVVKDRTQTKINLLQMTNEPALNELILKCMEILPDKRPTLYEIAACITAFTEERNEHPILLKEIA